MDKQSTLGFILIAIVLVVWMWWSSPRPSQQPQNGKQVYELKKDSSIAVKPEVEKKETPSKTESRQFSPKDSLGKFFSSAAVGNERIVTIETDLYTAQISTKGAVIQSFELKNYKTWDQRTVQLVENASGETLAFFLHRRTASSSTQEVYFLTLRSLLREASA